MGIRQRAFADNWGCPLYKKLLVKKDKLELKERLYFAWNEAVLQDGVWWCVARNPLGSGADLWVSIDDMDDVCRWQYNRQDAYARRVLEAAQGPLRFYAEIHGNDRAECAGQIEIVTVGVDRELALRLRALAELIRDAHLRGNREIQRLDVSIEPAEAARGAILTLPLRALQIDVPRCARRDWRETYTSILADFLAQAVTLPLGR